MTRHLLRTLLTTLAGLYLAAAATADTVGEVDIREVLPLTSAQRDTLAKIVRTEPSAKALFAELRSEAMGLLDDKPAPIAVIHYEGLVHTEPKRLETVKHLADMDKVAALFNYWQASGNDKQAQQAAEQVVAFVVAWMQTYLPTGNDVNENKLVPVIVAGSQFRERMTAQQRAQFNAWLTRLGELHAEAVAGDHHALTNRYTKRLRLLMYIARGLDRPEWAKLARRGFERFVTESLYPDGTSHDLKRRDTLTYHSSALRPLLDLAQLLDDHTLYVWSPTPEGGSVKKSVDYVLPYARGEKTREEWKNTTIELDRRRAEAGLEEYRPGRLFEPKRAMRMLDQAAYFDPDIRPLVRKLAETDAKYPTWRSLLNDAMRNHAEQAQ